MANGLFIEYINGPISIQNLAAKQNRTKLKWRKSSSAAMRVGETCALIK
jgi:hypothetical protein